MGASLFKRRERSFQAAQLCRKDTVKMERNEIFTAKTFDEAKQLAAEAFNADELDIQFEIIEQPKKGLFGGIKGEFRIRAIHKSPQKPNAPKPKESPKKTPVASTKGSISALSQTSKEDFKQVIEYVEKILSKLGIEGYAINFKKSGDSNVLDITGDNLGIIIGRRGETLDALQYLAILANNMGGDEKGRPRLLIDCNGYREKRADALESLAIRTSNKVLKQGRRITLEPMNPYERRIIHSKIAGIDGVYSSSVGGEPYRKVVISADIAKKRSIPNERSGGGNNGSRQGGRNDRDRDRSVLPVHAPGEVSNAVQSKSYKKSEGFSTSFEREYKRTVAAVPEISKDTVEVEKNTNLYGKIEL